MKKRNQLILLLFLLASGNLTLNAQVVINEFSAANFDEFIVQIAPTEYDDADWIELYNTGTESVDLTGYHLSDKEDNPTKWAFPSGVTIGPDEYLVIYATGQDGMLFGNLHCAFKIKQTKGNEDVIFSDPSGTILDSHLIDIPNQTNHSRARFVENMEWGVSTNPTPGAENDVLKYEYAGTPEISPDAGFYAGSVTVEITAPESNVTIFYTLDGSAPTTSSTTYTEPFVVDETTVVRSVAFSDDQLILLSFIDTKTYFVDEDHSLKVISIAGDEDLSDLLDGTQNDPVGSFELFDINNGERIDETVGEFNKHGNDSWAYDQRGIDYIVRDQFGYTDAVKDDLFTTTDRDEFQKLILKAAANDNYPAEDGAHIRDAFVHHLSQVADLELDERSYAPCVMYLNGEYWGVYEMREKVDDHDYTDYNYDQDKLDLLFIKTWGGTWEEYGEGVAINEWDDLYDFILNNDMTDDANYAMVQEELEVISMIDYVILHSINVSMDWLNWNTAWWRGTNPDGEKLKWRYILWDEDATFGHYINYTGVPNTEADADPCDPEELTFVGEGHIEIFNALYQNEDFMTLYINRYADLNNTYFNCDFMIPLLDSLINVIAPEMPRQIDRWGGSVSGWEDNVQELRDFILTRCELIDEGIVDCYEDDGITGPWEITINVEPVGAGKVQANSVIGQNYPWATTYFGGIGVTLTAIPEMGSDFLFWEVANNSFGPDQFQAAIDFSLTSDDVITAYFSGGIPCNPPEDFVIDSSFTSVNLSWFDLPTTLSYDISYREVGTADWLNFSNIEANVTLGDLEPCTPYEVEVRAVCSSSLSDVVELDFMTSCMPSASSELDGELSEVSIFPNPFEHQFTVDFSLAEGSNVQMELLTITGKRMTNFDLGNFPSGQHQHLVELPNDISSGIYLVRLTTANGLVIKRLVKE